SYRMPAEKYHADPAPAPSLSSTIARILLAQSPQHAWHASPRLNKAHRPVVKTEYEIGRAAHTLLTRQGAGIHIMSFDDYRKKDARDERDAALADGKTLLLEKQYDEVAAMVAACRRQLIGHGIGDVFETGECERAHFSVLGGCWARCMTDCEHGDIVYDYKTTGGSASPEAAIKTIADFGYDAQAAHYLDVLESLETDRPRTFRFIIQEKTAPYALSVVQIDDGWLAVARRKTRRARQIWTMCLDEYGAKPWPGYPAQIVRVQSPPWHEQKWLDREAMEQDFRDETGADVLSAALKFQAPMEANQ
ncbi:MAG: PD-(D/E)XK nuclease-like domain-containing protein, partial [Pseudomonadota bacterium]